MRKRLFSLFVISTMMLSLVPMNVSAKKYLPYGTTYEDMGYEIYDDCLAYIVTEDNTVTITAFDDSDAEKFEIPSKIAGLPVTGIDEEAFVECRRLISIKIPDSITSIGYRAFQACENLTEVTIPDSVTSIGDGAFSSCDDLIKIDVDQNNKYYTSDNGVLFDKNKTTLIQYPAGKADTHYTIPDSVTSIGRFAFMQEVRGNLSSVTIPDSVTNINSHAFDSCYSLTSIIIPDSVTTIGVNAFFDCSNLTNVTLGNNIANIGANAFHLCDSLTNITIPDSVTTIEANTFYYCSSLTSITLPDSVTSIGDWTFTYCDNLTDVYYGGTKEQWEKISIGSENEELTEANIHYSSIISVLLNGTKLTFDQPPIIENDRTMVPIRAIFEALGYTLDWNGDTQTATATNGSNTIKVTVGSNTIFYTGGTYNCDVAPINRSGRILVPVRAIAECAGCTVDWDGETKTVIINS